jgi:P4 family phage/plasmid primase-like protien
MDSTKPIIEQIQVSPIFKINEGMGLCAMSFIAQEDYTGDLSDIKEIEKFLQQKWPNFSMAENKELIIEAYRLELYKAYKSNKEKLNDIVVNDELWRNTTMERSVDYYPEDYGYAYNCQPCYPQPINNESLITPRQNLTYPTRMGNNLGNVRKAIPVVYNPIRNGVPYGGVKQSAFKNSFNEDKDDEKLTPLQATARLKKKFPIASKGGALFAYFDGFYMPVDKERTQTMLINIGCKEAVGDGTPQYLTSIYDLLRVHPLKNLPMDYDESRYVAGNNGVLDTETMQLYPNDGKIFVTSKLNVDFIQYDTIPQTPVFDSFLRSISGGDVAKERRLMEIIGYLLSSDNNARAFFAFVGATGSGKSTIGKFIQRICNQDAIAALDLDDLNERFDTSQLIGKKINLGMDLPNGKISSKAAGKLKKLTSGDLVKGEEKYKSPVFFVNTCRMLFASNYKITTETADPALMDRMVTVKFPYTIPKSKRNYRLVDDLLNEKEAIVFKCLMAYKELQARNYQFTECYEPDASDDSDTLQPMDWNSIIYEFAMNCCDIVPEAKISNADLFTGFERYCSLKNIPLVIKQPEFTIKFKAIVEGMGVKFKKVRIGQSTPNGAEGIILRQDFGL